jgi:hypothetical protein
MYVSENYKLFFNWVGLRYEGEVALFDIAWFDGPVLCTAAKIESNTYIDLDFTSQNITTDLFLPQNFYVARLSWKEVEYLDNKVFLKGSMLSHNAVGSLKNLQDGFKFMIDCSKHEEHMHKNFLVYPSWVLKPTNDIIQQEE